MNYSDIQKDKIRNKYKGVNPDELDVIHAIPHVNLHEDTREKRVADYARVSTDDSSQTSSYELQKNHYMDVVNNHIGWKLINIYADEGISGTSLRHRDEFVKMINDCKAGKIDLKGKEEQIEVFEPIGVKETEIENDASQENSPQQPTE